jgi:hypothetical protein
MAFDPSLPSQIYANDVGNIYFVQGGSYYDGNFQPRLGSADDVAAVCGSGCAGGNYRVWADGSNGHAAGSQHRRHGCH